MNSYQKAKAKKIAGAMVLAAVAASAPLSDLAEMVARMTPDQWRTFSFQAGVPVLDTKCKVLVIAYLLSLA